MPSHLPRHKGTGLLPIVKALAHHPAGPAAVPAELKHYLDDYVVSSGWYPEHDYHVLLHILAELVMKERRVPDVWEYFGKVAAQRDLSGVQSLIPARSRLHVAGIYRNFVSREATGIYSLFARLSKLWSLYHDTGKMDIGRGATDAACVHVRVADFVFASRGVEDIQMAYCHEYARLTGNLLIGTLVSSSANGEPITEWRYTCERSPEILEAIAQLPLLT
jgi:hypothetical protein